MAKGLYCGSFDPFTLGHLAVVEKALGPQGLCNELVICVGDNPKKKTLFSAEQRRQMIEETLADCPYKDKVTVIAHGGMTVDIADKYRCAILVRGVRVGSNDLTEEHILEEVNTDLAAVRHLDIETWLIRIDDGDLCHVSSSLVKQLCEYGEFITVSRYVPNCVMLKLAQVYLKNWFLTKHCSKNHLLSEWDNHIVPAYCGRAYHNLMHVAYMINILRAYENQTVMLPSTERRSLVCAILLHDYVYVPGRDDNELRSAQYAEGLGWFVAGDLIKATAQGAKCSSLLERLLVDLDLSILGTADDKIYEWYRQGIRQEYAEFDDKSFKKRRLAFIDALLAQERIFQTEWFYNHFEENARYNLSCERDDLA